MYQLKAISEQVHDEFLNTHIKEHFMQTSTWGKIKAQGGRWSYETIGLFKKDELVASSMLMKRKIPLLNSYIFYAPRGFIIDFNDDALLENFTIALKQYIKKANCCYLMLDPDYYYRKMDGEGSVIDENLSIIKKMQELGYRHNGFLMNFEMGQPRFTFRLNLKQEQEAIFSGFSKIIRTNMRTSANYITCTKSDDLHSFYAIIQDTAKRDDFIEATYEHYENIYKLLKMQNMATLYIATYLPCLHKTFLEDKDRELQSELAKLQAKLELVSDDKKAINRIKQIEEQRAKTLKTMIGIDEAINLYPNGINLAAGITINTSHRAWLVYGGNRTIYRDVCANYAIKQYEILDDIAKDFEFVDFFGTIGNPTLDNPLFGIHDFKRKFGGDYIEFPGEFHLVNKTISYFLWIKLYPLVVQTMRKMTIKKRKHTKGSTR